MRALIQRVKSASVSINGSPYNKIGRGLLIFLGVGSTDNEENAVYLAKRCANLRIFGDNVGKMNLSVKDISGEALVISQFTLYADTRKGNRPCFTDAAPPDRAENYYNQFISFLRNEIGGEKVYSGEFRAMMDIALVNDGPVTIILENK